MLLYAGYSVFVVENGVTAVELFKTTKFDIVFMDIQMPQMDGFEATRLIREYEKESGLNTPIIAMTAYALDDDRNNCLAKGMDDYISKPLKSSDLIAIAKKWIQKL